MPIYEYRCQSCSQLSSFFTRSISTPLEAICAHCNSSDMQRRMSSFAMGKTTQSVHDRVSSGAGPAPSDYSRDYYSDPRNIGRNVEEGFRRYGMEMPPGVRDKIEAAREGDLPKGLDS